MAKSLVSDQVREMSEKSATTTPENPEATTPHKKSREESSLWEGDHSDSPLSTSDVDREMEQFLGLPRLPHS